MASFDRLGPWYGRMERWFSGGIMRRARVALIDQLRPPKSVLLVGEGPGDLVCELARRFPGARLTCLDVSEEMMKVGRERLKREMGDGAVCEWIRGDVRVDAVNDGPWDLVVTSFVLDCFSTADLEAVVAKLGQVLTRTGEWLVVDFQIPTGGGIRAWRAAVVVWMLYRFFRWVTGLSAKALVPPQPFLASTGLDRVARRELDWGMVYAEIWRVRPEDGQASAGASAADC